MRLCDRFKKDGDFLFRNRSYLPLILIPIFMFVIFSFGSPLYKIEIVSYVNVSIKDIINNSNIGYYNNALIIFAIFVGLLGQSIRILVAGFVPKDTSGRNTKEQKASVLNTKGLYSTCRNPLYLGNFLMMLSPVILVGNWIFVLFFIVIFWLYYERIIYAEEAFLSEKFKDEYIIWANNTPCFIPSFKNYSHSNSTFSFKSMLKREYHSLFGLASSLILVNYIIIIIMFDFKMLQPSYILCGFFIVCLIIYIICLFLSKKTNILFVENR
ncbi:isoprenylcysteine carboxylmethyltransferase family protein [Helicobacter sp. MIT 14-3879]|uniref:methyltransferase family protein n=1 Tax=Helicobacter sp. MIT 14-3879 TaxID=2040649 RepID=UPI000E1F5D6D|nr:isoprenylcysteine carboxylmethyltransferase family protein [Helicobacter sp. MIT 14-3879]RDU62884.1 methyltransferase [Helicobacter sp. MIT 14-3879]